MLFDPGFKSQSPMGNPTQDFASALNAMRSSLQGAPLNSPSGTVQNGLENIGQQTAQQQPSATPPTFDKNPSYNSNPGTNMARPFPYDNLGSSGSGLGQLAQRAVSGMGGMGGMGGAGGGQSMNLGNLSVNFNPSGGGMSFAKGGEVPSSGGLKSIAQELPSYGRYNDDMVAHISSDEARLLKSLGGAGTINPTTGLPEYGLKKVWKNTVGRVEDAVKPITKPITDAIKPILPYVQYVAPFIPGVNAAYAAAMGALGSGFAGGGGFNFKRGLMGGMTAYGLSNLYAGLQGAATGAGGAPTVPGTEVAAPSVADVGANLGVEGAVATGPGSQSALLAEQAAGFGDAGLSNIASSASYATPTPLQLGLGGAEAYGQVAQTGLTEPTMADMPFLDRAKAFGSDMGGKFINQMSNAGQGIKNLSGLGEGTMADAAKGFKGAGATLTNTLGAGYMGYTGSMALDEYEKQKKEAELAGATDEAQRAALQQEIAVIDARIQENKRRAEQAVRNNPYQFADGGPVDDEAGTDDYYGGGIAAMAKGGQPRFLSGGGDGMSDGIKATINGKQPARLADGEFVIPADVVSHLGNGSSKAGAKQLYSMMDKVRSARTGTKKQGKQINPARFMPA